MTAMPDAQRGPMWRTGAALLLTFTACPLPASETAVVKPVAAPAAATEAALKLAPDGLLVAGKLVPFNVSRASAELAIGKVQGLPLEKGSSSECSAGTVEYTSYGNDLQLTFQDGKFVGWTINSAQSPLKTAKDIGVGSPRQSLDAAYGDVMVEDSSLGLLFGAGGLVGILDQDGIEGIVTGLWAGTVCLID